MILLNISEEFDDGSEFESWCISQCNHPPLGVSLEGSFSDIRAADVHDDLYAHALVVDDGQTEVVIVSVDVCSIPPAITQEIATLILRDCQIPLDNILITATHTHTGPALDDEMMGGVFNIPPDYLSHFKKMVASTVRLAQLRKQPVRLGAGKGTNAEFVFNRRLKKPDGSIVMNWINKEYLQDCVPSGVVDTEVGVIKFENMAGQAVGMIVNYANHNNAFHDPVRGSVVIGADYAGVMRQELMKIYGSQVVILFMPGAAGNINWINHRAPEPFADNLYQHIGRSLAGTVLEIDARLEYFPAPIISAYHRQLSILERPSTEYDTKVDFTFGPPEHSTDFFDAYQKAAEKYARSEPRSHPVNVNVIRFGEQVALCSNPAELFVEFGLELKAKSPARYTLFAELTNGAIGYVPTRQAFSEGGYEVRKLPGNSVLAVDAGDLIIQTLLELLAISK